MSKSCMNAFKEAKPNGVAEAVPLGASIFKKNNHEQRHAHMLVSDNDLLSPNHVCKLYFIKPRVPMPRTYYANEGRA